MKLTLNTAPTAYRPEHAERLAAELQKGDPDWTYQVVHNPSGWSRIAIYDEEGEFVGYHSNY